MTDTYIKTLKETLFEKVEQLNFQYSHATGLSSFILENRETVKPAEGMAALNRLLDMTENITRLDSDICGIIHSMTIYLNYKERYPNE